MSPLALRFVESTCALTCLTCSQLFIAERDRLGGVDAFFAKHGQETVAEDGERRYITILHQLKDEKAARDAAAAADATRCFGGDLASDPQRRFMYYETRSKTWRVLSQSCKIAEKWKEILETDEDVKRAWDAMRAL